MFVASSPQLAAFSIGGVGGFSNVILEQLKSPDSPIQVDFDTATWIGSTQGLAGIPSIAMPMIMQWRGRKFSYIISCLLVFTGWMLIYFSKNVATIIIGECFHGLGINSTIIVSLCTISEVVDPRYRAISLSFYVINEVLGVSMCGIMGRYLHWKTVSIIMSLPIIIALIISLAWPESPSWLAYKGQYARCEENFKWLRGSDEKSHMELKELLRAQKERCIANRNTKKTFNVLWLQITSKDFYVPCFHSFVLLCSFYLSGHMVIIVYGVDIIQKLTNSVSTARYGIIAVHVSAYVATLSTALYLKLCKNKTVFIASGLSAAFFMLCTAIVTLLQSVDILYRNSIISTCFIVFFCFFVSSGVSSLAFDIPNELMPVKHRGLGGALYIIQLCVLHTSVLKLSPYLLLYMSYWGTFMLFSVVEIVIILYIWKYVPETKGRTLQEIEDFYCHGSFTNKRKDDVECIDIGNENKKDENL